MKRRHAQEAAVKPAVAILLVVLLVIGVSWASCRKKKAAQVPTVELTTDVIISEVMTNNTGMVSDGAGNHPDYVELHNVSAVEQNISGWGLSDREDRLWIFPDGTVLPPDGYILVWCTGEEVENALIADFKLGAGDVIRLTNAAGEPLFTMELPSIYTGYTLSWDDVSKQYALR